MSAKSIFCYIHFSFFPTFIYSQFHPSIFSSLAFSFPFSFSFYLYLCSQLLALPFFNSCTSFNYLLIWFISFFHFHTHPTFIKTAAHIFHHHWKYVTTTSRREWHESWHHSSHYQWNYANNSAVYAIIKKVTCKGSIIFEPSMKMCSTIHLKHITLHYWK